MASFHAGARRKLRVSPAVPRCKILVCGNVLVDDLLHRAVGDQLFQRLVKRLRELAALCKGRRVIFDRVGGIENLEAFVCRDEGFSRLIVDNNAI